MSVSILTGDAIQLLPPVSPAHFEPFGLVLADPPFNCGKDYGEGVDDSLPLEAYQGWMTQLARACYLAAAEDATCYWFCPGTHLLGEDFHLPTALRLAGWRIRDKELCVWYRPNGPGPRKRGTGQIWAAMSEFIVMAVKGKGLAPRPGWGKGKDARAEPIRHDELAPWYHNVMTVFTPQSNHPGGRYHPCQKPLKLYRYLIQAHRDVRRVLDPTCGSGSSLVVCAQLGIDALGIDVVPETAELARARVKAAIDGVSYQAARMGQGSIFAEEGRQP